MYFAYMDCTRTLRTRIHPTHPACAHPACWVANSSYRWRQPCDQQHGLTTKPYCIEGGLRMFSHRNCFALLCFFLEKCCPFLSSPVPNPHSDILAPSTNSYATLPRATVATAH